MTHVITSLCVREGSCVTVCPVECIVPGKPQDTYPIFYIDPETCIDCGACVPQCPFGAIFPLDEVPADFVSEVPRIISFPKGVPGYDQPYETQDYEGNTVYLDCTRTLAPGESFDFTIDIDRNAKYFSEGTGYEALRE